MRYEIQERRLPERQREEENWQRQSAGKRQRKCEGKDGRKKLAMTKDEEKFNIPVDTAAGSGNPIERDNGDCQKHNKNMQCKKADDKNMPCNRSR